MGHNKKLSRALRRSNNQLHHKFIKLINKGRQQLETREVIRIQIPVNVPSSDPDPGSDPGPDPGPGGPDPDVEPCPEDNAEKMLLGPGCMIHHNTPVTDTKHEEIR